MEPTYISKFNTFVQILLIVIVIFALATQSVSEIVIQANIYLVLATTAISGAQYIIVWGRKALHKSKMEQSNDS
jgi:cardiolipin synthase